MTRIFTIVLVLLLMGALGTAVWFFNRGMHHNDIVSALDSGHYSRAATLMHEQIDKGNTIVLTTLANLYYLGLGVDQNYAESARLYSRAAFSGNTAAQINLGHMYGNGLGLARDIELAYAWFNHANDNGSTIASTYMAEMLSDHKLNFRVVENLRAEYVTINNFPKLH